jgi:hypothetical protein
MAIWRKVFDSSVLGDRNELLDLDAKGIPDIFLTSYSAATIPAQPRHRPLVSKPYSPAQLLHVGRADLVEVMEHLGPHDTPRKNWRPA